MDYFYYGQWRIFQIQDNLIVCDSKKFHNYQLPETMALSMGTLQVESSTQTPVNKFYSLAQNLFSPHSLNALSNHLNSFERRFALLSVTMKPQLLVSLHIKFRRTLLPAKFQTIASEVKISLAVLFVMSLSTTCRTILVITTRDNWQRWRFTSSKQSSFWNFYSLHGYTVHQCTQYRAV